MILPTKRIPEDRALLAIGADILGIIERPQTVSKVWDELRKLRSERPNYSSLTFDWFTLALTMLYAMNALAFENGRLRRVKT
jgi:hypothetical protein